MRGRPWSPTILGGDPVAFQRLLWASREALRIMDTMSLDDLMEGRDAQARADLKAAIDAIEEVEI